MSIHSPGLAVCGSFVARYVCWRFPAFTCRFARQAAFLCGVTARQMELVTGMRPWPELAPWAQRIDLSRGRLFYYDCGPANAGQTVVLIHGLGDEADTWRHIIPLLVQAGYRILAPDLPGFGRSVWGGPINVHVHANMALDLLVRTRAASPERPALFVGSSMGAGIAELAAFKRPAMVSGLALLDGCYPFSGPIPRGFLAMALPLLGRSWYRGFRNRPEAAVQSLFPYYHSFTGLPPEDQAFLKERVMARVESANQERAYFASLRSMNAMFLFARASYARQVRRFPGRFMLIWGAEDRIFPLEKAALFHALRPEAVFVTIAGAGHLPHQEQPQKTADALLSFFSSR